jgi:hypothetical protein
MLLPFVKTHNDGKLRRKYDAKNMENTRYFLVPFFTDCPKCLGGSSL